MWASKKLVVREAIWRGPRQIPLDREWDHQDSVAFHWMVNLINTREFEFSMLCRCNPDGAVSSCVSLAHQCHVRLFRFRQSRYAFF